MDIYVRDANAFRKVTNLWVHDGSVNRNIASAWVHDGTDWRQVYFKFTPGFQPTLGGSFSTYYAAPDYTMSLYSHLTVRTDGSVRVWWEWYKHDGYGNFQPGGPYTSQFFGRWGSPLSAGEGVNYYIKYHDIQNDFNKTASLGDTRDSWLQLNTERSFSEFWAGPWDTHQRQYTLSLATSPNDGDIVATWSDWITTNFWVP
jgi:hypothetical protein